MRSLMAKAHVIHRWAFNKESDNSMLALGPRSSVSLGMTPDNFRRKQARLVPTRLDVLQQSGKSEIESDIEMQVSLYLSDVLTIS